MSPATHLGQAVELACASWTSCTTITSVSAAPMAMGAQRCGSQERLIVLLDGMMPRLNGEGVLAADHGEGASGSVLWRRGAVLAREPLTLSGHDRPVNRRMSKLIPYTGVDGHTVPVPTVTPGEGSGPMSRARLPPGRLLLGLTLGLLLVSQLAACSGADRAHALGGQPRPRPTTVPSAVGRNAARAAASGSAGVAPTPLPAEVAAVMALTNQDRLAHGCPALAPNPILMGTAQAHSADMALHHFFAHLSSTGLTPPQRILAAGYQWAAVAENIAAGYPTAQSVVDTWFNETPPNDPHRANMLNCGFHDVGVGYYYLAADSNSIAYHEYWTEDFGTLASS